ncbi:MAG: type II toxin-antitoxin system RelE/ParE family toxin [Actinomycetota bacterium]|nr:type II toxin-antitoxin system RelE/ParE family toxin [Actinomycetota bacterium]
MRYSVIVQRRAQKRLARFPTNIQDRIERSLQALSDEPRPPGSRKLRGKEGWRIRVGDYRAIYEIDDEAREVIVVDIGHRRDIYR